MPKQASLMGRGVAAIAKTISRRIEETEPPKLNAVIVKLEPPAFGRCSLCNRQATLCLCLELFNSEGDMILWGETCEDCKREWEKREKPVKQTKRFKTDKLIVGGLHMDDFEWASRLYKEIGYVLVAFVLDRDGYHWKAIYVKACEGEP